jgi:hypothetical protein
MENNRMGCINRDKNSVKNMAKLTKYFLEHKARPERYRRGFDLEANTKEIKQKTKRHQPLESNGVKPKNSRE